MSDITGDAAILLDRLKSGDRQALAQLFAQHRPRLWRTVHFRLDYRLRSRVDPDDVLQEAYLWAADQILTNGILNGEGTTVGFAGRHPERSEGSLVVGRSFASLRMTRFAQDDSFRSG